MDYLPITHFFPLPALKRSPWACSAANVTSWQCQDRSPWQCHSDRLGIYIKWAKKFNRRSFPFHLHSSFHLTRSPLFHWMALFSPFEKSICQFQTCFEHFVGSCLSLLLLILLFFCLVSPKQTCLCTAVWGWYKGNFSLFRSLQLVHEINRHSEWP